LRKSYLKSQSLHPRLGFGGLTRCGVLPQIGALHLRVIEQALAGSGEHDAAAFHHVAEVRDLQRLAGILLDQQNGFFPRA
jgi:hypothetical protein